MLSLTRRRLIVLFLFIALVVVAGFQFGPGSRAAKPETSAMIGGPLITATALNIFRGERVGTIFGTISIGSGLGSGLGSWAGGLIHDWTQGYNWLIAFALVNVVLGLIPFLVVPALRR